MKNTKKKPMIASMIAVMVAAISMMLVLSFTAVSASAAYEPVQEIVTMEADAASAPAVRAAAARTVILPMAGGGATTGSATAESSYQTVLTFFITWLRRIGAAVALIGGIMFGLAIKDNNAEQKQAGLMTMVAGFVVVAICLAAGMFDLFS